jgi:hypothetical protein
MFDNKNWTNAMSWKFVKLQNFIFLFTLICVMSIIIYIKRELIFIEEALNNTLTSAKDFTLFV